MTACFVHRVNYIVRRDRPLNGQNGGGVCFFNYVVREDLVSDQLENLSIEIIKP